MEKPDFWTSYADAMELSVEGNRLIAREIVALARSLLARLVRSGQMSPRGGRGVRSV